MCACPRWLQGMLILIVLLPLLTSVVVRTFAWIVILGRQGIVNTVLLDLGLIDSPLRLLYTEGGVVVALAQVQMPLMVLPLITALTRIDPNLADASSALGAGYWRTFCKVTLPLTLARHHRRLPAHLCGGDHRLHHADADRRRADAVHADVSLPAGLDAEELAVRRRDLVHFPGRRAGRDHDLQHARQDQPGLRQCVRLRMKLGRRNDLETITFHARDGAARASSAS